MEKPGDGGEHHATQGPAQGHNEEEQSPIQHTRQVLVRAAPSLQCLVPRAPASCSSARPDASALSIHAVEPSTPASLNKQRQKPKKKKRVRKEQVELKFLRVQARRLELHLEQLKLWSQSRAATSGLASSTIHEGRSNTGLPTKNLPVWEGIAMRQCKDRMRAEQENQRLKDSQTVHTGVLRQLHRKLRMGLNDEQLCLLERYKAKKQEWWDVSSEDDAVIYSGQLAYLIRMSRDMEHQCDGPSQTVQFRWELGLVEGVLKPNPGAGILYEMHVGTMVPFDLDVAASAYWTVFQGSSSQIFTTTTCQDFDLDSNVAFRSVSVRLEHKGKTVQMHGKQTARKYVDKDVITLSAAATVWPVEFGGVKFRGLHTQQTSWLKLRRIVCQSRDGRQAPSCTYVETHYKMMPVFEEGAPNQEQQARALFEMTSKIQNALNDEYSQTLSAVLLKKDWEARYGSEFVEA